MLVRLDANDFRNPAFDCGNDDLNEFFLKDSKFACSELMSVTYAWIDGDKTAAFLSLSNDSVNRRVDSSAYNLAARRVPNSKRFMTLPAVKIGRLAVTVDKQGKNIGSLILDTVKNWFAFGNRTGCRFVVVGAINTPQTIKFYQKNGFSFLSKKDKDDPTRLMFFDLITVKNGLIR